jgi:hypothetical protein
MRAWIITGSALGGKYASMSNYKGLTYLPPKADPVNIHAHTYTS